MAAKVIKLTPVTPEEFVRVWQTCRTVGEVADKLNLTKRACYQRAVAYRKKGVPLKKYPKGRYSAHHDIDYPALASLAKSLS
tara:strand:+ start:3340 stop:3585 length:246 start_codon:yes stop_codon:yes gene_type:complete